ncbi:hypothetical protein CDO52_00460 [Nocardiopsis gilva YIM 90087]|uniref:YbaK/aminoacyl-tRNA synthetase-associated domain-containing protein n=1 Tax=Nocardiopsis gilva YIM 90087 TaxID=1235441 RepID=A0A223RZZ0_9ACTN|nr:YbaK/EbsC family protein [Nocardiopsis gilva]ASU81450.1 hypothetical protein CDO52_00460 [Nocardiopsis gilva YIM 90087]
MKNTSPSTPSEILNAGSVPFTSFGHAPIRTLEDIERELALPPEKLLKTMAFRVADAQFVLAAVPILARVHYGRLARAVGVARSQLRQAGDEDLRELGMEPGGISPLTRLADATVVFDEAVADMGVVYCGSGRADGTIKIEARDLVAAAGAEYAPIAH